MRKLWVIIMSALLFDACAQELNPLKLEALFLNDEFQERSIKPLDFAPDSESIYELKSDRIIKRSLLNSDTFETIIDFTQFVELKDRRVSAYQFSPDGKKLLLTLEKKFIYRHSYEAEHYIIDLKKQVIFPLSERGPQSIPEFSPNSQCIAYVQNNDIFVFDIQKDREMAITFIGKRNSIISGTTDWVYEEEFGFTKAFWWSPQSDKIAFLRFNESQVKEFSFTLWGHLYPDEFRYKYPKAGEENSRISLLIYDFKTDKRQEVDLGSNPDIYVPLAQFTHKNNEFMYMRLNRLQNHMELRIFNTKDATDRLMYEERNAAYIEVPSKIWFLTDGKQALLTSERSGYNHLYLVPFDGGAPVQLTKGDHEVTAIYGIDESKRAVYYQSTQSASYNRDICKINLDGSQATIISTQQGTNVAAFSPNMKYYVNTYSDANTPRSYTLNKSDGSVLMSFEDNAILKAQGEKYGFVKKVFGSMLNSQGDMMPYWIMRPETVEPGKKYPLLMFVYGGPGSQQVSNVYQRTDYLWYQYLVSQGYIVACVDGRGTGFRGESYKKCIYLQLGILETIDQIEAAKHFASMSIIDSQRIGIWGWSYGGFMSSSCLFKAPEVFKMAISVAPVTNWKYYNSVYTERFMRRPQENGRGYEDGSPINYVNQLKGSFLLVHGTADDNVHVQNTMEMVTALNEAGKHYDLYLYPNKNHSILGTKTRLHLYQKMTDFIFRNL